MSRSARGFWNVATAVVLTAVLLVGHAVPAAADPGEETALGFVPQDAAFFSSSLRLGEQYEAFVNSRAFATIKEMPSVKQGLEMLNQQLNNPFSPLGMARAQASTPENQQLLQLLGDAVSNEVFVYGDLRYAQLALLMQKVNVGGRTASAKSQLEGNNDPLAQVRGMLVALNENRDEIVVPNTVIGFKLTDKERALAQLKRLDTLITQIQGTNPNIGQRFGKVTVADREYTTLVVRGDQFPWEQQPFAGFEEEPGQFDPLVEKLKQLELTIALGLWNDYMLLSFGETAEHLARLDGDKPLYGRKEFDPVRKYADREFTSFQYVSEEYARTVNAPDQAAQVLQQAIQALVPGLPVDDATKQQMLQDAGRLPELVKRAVGEPGATMAFGFESPRGFEGYAYDWSEQTLLDATQELALARHLGGNPVAFGLFRTRYAPEDYELFVEIVEKVYGYAEDYALSQLNEQEKQQFQKAKQLVLPLVKRADTTTREKLIPALKDGQQAFVLDAKVQSKQWHPAIPESSTPLPMAELALVYGVSDAELLEEAARDYHGLLREFLAKMHEFSPEEFPEVTLPAPEESSVDGARMFSWSLPPQARLDEQIQPTVGLSDDVAVMAITPAQAKRVLQPTPLGVTGGPFERLSKPAAAAANLNFPAFVDAVEPWVEFGVTQYFASQAISTGGENTTLTIQGEEMQVVLDQIRTAAKVLKCFRGASSVTYAEGEATVTHSESRWQDLPQEEGATATP